MEGDSFSDKNITPDNRSGEKENTYKKFWFALITFTFFVLLCGMLALRLILPTPAVSMAENRELNKMPSADLNNIFLGKFTTEFENFFADTFPLRDPLMSAGEYVSYIYKIPIEGVDSVVAVADNDSIQNEETGEDAADVSDLTQYLKSGDPVSLALDITKISSLEKDMSPGSSDDIKEPIKQPQQAAPGSRGIYLLTDTSIFKEVILNPGMYERWAQSINRLHEAIPDKNVIVMTLPNSFAFYADTKYYKPENDQKAGIADMYGKIDTGIIKIDTAPFFDRYKNEYIFFRTDLHWTARGAYCGYLAFCEKMGFLPLPLDSFEYNAIYPDFLGSYYKQVKGSAKLRIIRKNPDYLEYFVPPVECVETVYNNADLINGKERPIFDTDVKNKATYYYMFIGDDYPCVKITTGTHNGKTLMIVKDSYADALAPFLVPHYQTIYLLDFRDYNAPGKRRFKAADFAEQNDVDDVMCIMNFEFVNNTGFSKWYIKMMP